MVSVIDNAYFVFWSILRIISAIGLDVIVKLGAPNSHLQNSHGAQPKDGYWKFRLSVILEKVLVKQILCRYLFSAKSTEKTQDDKQECDEVLQFLRLGPAWQKSHDQREETL